MVDGLNLEQEVEIWVIKANVKDFVLFEQCGVFNTPGYQPPLGTLMSNTYMSNCLCSFVSLRTSVTRCQICNSVSRYCLPKLATASQDTVSLERDPDSSQRSSIQTIQHVVDAFLIYSTMGRYINMMCGLVGPSTLLVF